MIGVFLALLELIRQKKILVVQGDEHTDMEITPRPKSTGARTRKRPRPIRPPRKQRTCEEGHFCGKFRRKKLLKARAKDDEVA